MSNCAIVGINWGDEGKGRMVDYLTQQYDVVVRYQGGGNAGHTVINEKGKFALHLLPSGIFRSGVMNILGNGVALDCENLLKEIDTVRQGGVDITPERAEKYDFSTPYAYNRTAVITQKDNDSIKTLEDLNGKTTANTISSTYAELAEQYGATVTGVDDLNQTFELLLSGRIDATLNAEVTYYDYMKEHPDANAKIAVLAADANEVAIPMRKGEETATLRAAIDTAIEEMRTDGTLKELSEKYFGTDISTNE